MCKDEDLARLLLTEFFEVMDEWKFRPWRDGQVPLVTLDDAAARLAGAGRREVQPA